MIATNEETLSGLFSQAIIGITPSITYKGSEGWKPYDRAVGGATRTRRFRLLWEPGSLVERGAMAGNVFETEAILRVRTDYTGDQAKTQFVWIEDFHQIGNVLTQIKATNNGVMLVTRQSVQEILGESDSDDVVQIDHVYSVRFMRAMHL
jgi:hypothetical protein